MSATARRTVGTSEPGPVAVVAATPARRARRRPRVAPVHVLMAVAALVGGLSAWMALHRAEPGEMVLVAAADLAPGRPIGPADLRGVRVAADPAAMAHMVAAEARAGLVGLVPRTVIAAGQVVAPELLAAPGARARTVSFGIARSRALDGDLAVGDRIDLLAAGDDGRAGYVLVDAAVLALHSPDAGVLGGGTDDVVVTAAVDAEGALRLAAALRLADLTVVRATDAPPVRAPRWWSTPDGAS